MEIETKFILTKHELKSLIEDGINAGLRIGSSTVYRDEQMYKKVDVAFNLFFEMQPTKTKLMFEEKE